MFKKPLEESKKQNAEFSAQKQTSFNLKKANSSTIQKKNCATAFEQLKTFCPLPWMHLSVHTSGKARLCCNAKHTAVRDVINEDGKSVHINQIRDMKEFFNLPFYKTIRKQMLRNQKPAACSPCYDMEKYGATSFRQQFKNYWKNSFLEFLNATEQDGTLKNVNVKYLDLPLGNLCNLSCRMCHPSVSIQMKKDYDHLRIQYGSSVDKYGEWAESPDLYKKLIPVLKTCEEIFFTGGEPLLIKQHKRILEQAIALNSAKNIRIKYNSNLTKLDSSLINLWKEFREVEFNCSIDGIEKVNDYIRYPSKWHVMERALETLDGFSDKYPHIKIYIHSTFQALNLFNIPKILQWTVNAKWRNVHRMPHFIWLYEPKFLQAAILPDYLKNQAIDRIEKTVDETKSFLVNYNKNHYQWNAEHLGILISYLKQLRETSQQEPHFKSFIHYTSKMDSFRKQDITQVIPEFKGVFYGNKCRQ